MGLYDYNYSGSQSVTPIIGASDPLAVATQQRADPTVTGGINGPQGVAGAAGAKLGLGEDATGLGFNLGTGKLVLGGIQAIGNIWNAWEANKLAKEQFAYKKDVTEANLANQIQSYNTTLEDRIRSRSAMESTSQASATSYLDSHKLQRRQAAA